MDVDGRSRPWMVGRAEYSQRRVLGLYVSVRATAIAFSVTNIGDAPQASRAEHPRLNALPYSDLCGLELGLVDLRNFIQYCMDRKTSTERYNDYRVQLARLILRGSPKNS